LNQWLEVWSVYFSGMPVEVEVEGELVGVEVGVEEVVVFLTEDWVAHIPLAVKIQRKELHMNRLTS